MSGQQVCPDTLYLVGIFGVPEYTILDVSKASADDVVPWLNLETLSTRMETIRHLPTVLTSLKNVPEPYVQLYSRKLCTSHSGSHPNALKHFISVATISLLLMTVWYSDLTPNRSLAAIRTLRRASHRTRANSPRR